MGMALDHRSVRLHGREVAYVTGGEGPTLLLIHGIGGDWRTWEPVLEGLARRHRVVAVDLPGHGGSAKGAGDYSLGALASALRDLGGALGVERATVVGHSLGGGVAMQFSYQFPERCERLVLVSSGGLGPDVGLALRLATLPGSEVFLSVAAPAARSLIGLAASAGRALRIRPAADAEFYARTFATLADPDTRAAFLGTLRGVVGARGQLVDARDRLYLAEHMPTLIVWGQRDAVLPVDHGHAAQDAMPGSRLEIFPDSGHLPQLDDPARFITVVEDFMATTEPSTYSDERWTDLLRSHGEAEPANRRTPAVDDAG
jgi:pimeloyl-ACP methyl ester carboxylesterase